MSNAGMAEHLAEACRLVSYELRRVKNCREPTSPTDGRIHGELVSQHDRGNASKKSQRAKMLATGSRNSNAPRAAHVK
jgi:hypothetical protein